MSCAVSNVICCLVFAERFSYDDKRFLHLLGVIAKILRFQGSFVGQVSGGSSLTNLMWILLRRRNGSNVFIYIKSTLGLTK